MAIAVSGPASHYGAQLSSLSDALLPHRVANDDATILAVNRLVTGGVVPGGGPNGFEDPRRHEKAAAELARRYDAAEPTVVAPHDWRVRRDRLACADCLRRC